MLIWQQKQQLVIKQKLVAEETVARTKLLLKNQLRHLR